MKRSGAADLPLYGGSIPPWLFERMKRLGLAVVESILVEKGHAEFIRRLADPFWFQSFAAVIGMDWNSSGATTAVMRALKRTINPHANSLGLHICGGKGNESRKTPNELLRIGDLTGLDGKELAHFSKLSAKVDNTAIQDGFQLYLHSFVVAEQGQWAVIQQGMQGKTGTARRYHWHSEDIDSFVEEPHAAICGPNQGEILNLTDRQARPTRSGILEIADERPETILREARHLKTPTYKDLKFTDVDLRRLGSILWTAKEVDTGQFEDLLLLKGLGPRTLQSLTLVSEIIHGTPSRFTDPARFVFAHGAKGGKPFPVPTRVYDETISTLRESVEKAKIGHTDKHEALKKLSALAQKAETGFT
ncbi:MAG: DUF763 domain-containing protein, partial [Bacteroidota bacterium]